MKKIKLNSDELSQLYLHDKLSITKISTKLKVDSSVVRKNLQLLNIPVRSPREAVILAWEMGIMPRGATHPYWQGGKYTDKFMGYVLVYIDPSDPLHVMTRTGKNYAFEHRIVMAKHLGRPLMPYELVHHKNGVRNDNRLENLEIYSRSEHNEVHRYCRGCPIKNELRIIKAKLKKFEHLAQISLC